MATRNTFQGSTLQRGFPVVRRLSASAVVWVGASGACIPRLDEHAALALSIDDLHLLSALATGASTLPPPQDASERLVAELDARQLLVERAKDDSRTGSFERASDGVEHQGSRAIALDVPLLFRLSGDGAFEAFDHDGYVLLRLSASSLAAAMQFLEPSTPTDAYQRHASTSVPSRRLDEAGFNELVQHLLAGGLATHGDERPATAVERQAVIAEVQQYRLATIRDAVGEELRAHLRDSASVNRSTKRRTRVIPIFVNHTIPSLALGLLFSYARSYKGGALLDEYDFVPSWILDPGQLAQLVAEPSVVLCSNYVWSSEQCLQLTRRVKALSPHSVVIHGGPNTPKYEADVEAYFHANPDVDVTVRGEGEQTTAELLEALIGQLGDHPADLSVLADVQGLSYRDGDDVVRTPDRPRIADLDDLPSPYLAGVFDGYVAGAAKGAPFEAVIETNRGCPYGCTFCDWGSATSSRLRKFSLDRVFAELEWCARNRVGSIALADANFGMLARDVEIAERLADLKSTYGYPERLLLAFAKSSVKNRQQIIEVLVGCGILTEGVVSLQSLDTQTLATIERSNIRLDKYDQLATDFRRAKLPLWVELMVGLPGSTKESFVNDLQDCVERELPARINQTELLVNSPMNEPGYRSKHEITVRSRGPALVVATATFSRDDHAEMLEARRDYMLFENLGILRQVARFVRQELGLREMDLYRGLRTEARRDPERWPALAFTERAVVHIMAPPVSWRFFVDEVRRYLVGVLGVADDDALAAVLAVQHALLPTRGRSFPIEIDLPHDVADWHRQVLEAKESGHRDDWPKVVARLATFDPSSFRVDDPQNVCELGIGADLEAIYDDTWDIESPVSRVHHLRPVTI